MHTTYSDGDERKEISSSLLSYRDQVKEIVSTADFSKPESCFAAIKDEDTVKEVERIAGEIGEVGHVILIGIGGSSLGTEAIFGALPSEKKLYVLDSVSPHRIKEIVTELRDVPEDDLAICSISKSGGTAETLTNTAVILEELREICGEKPFERLVCIGNPGNPLLTTGAELGAHTLAMTEAIGGRYSVFTAVGLMPLKLLGYDIRKLLEGLYSTLEEKNEIQAATGASALFSQLEKGVRSINFFAFNTRLAKLGFWWRQLTAESLGKEFDENSDQVELGFIPTISTPVELHSIGQLYFSGFKGVYTDFIRFAEREIDYQVPNNSVIATQFAGKTMKEINEAIWGGTVGAYQERNLPHRVTRLEYASESDLGLFMGMRMLETMYLAKLLNVNAFNQPNVELYKKITRDLLNS